MSDASGVPADQTRPGDLIFVHRKANDPLGDLMADLDGFHCTHVGIVTEPGCIVSARTRRVGWPPDTGGVIRNKFTDLKEDDGETQRRLYLGRNNLRKEAIAKTLEYIKGHWEEPAEAPRDDRSDFSFAKLFMVGAALTAVRPGMPEYPALPAEDSAALLAAAEKAAVEWDHTRQSPPGFYCSEFVAVAFGQSFERADLPIPDPASYRPRESGPSDFEASSLGQEISELVTMATESSVPQVQALVALIAKAAEVDPRFVKRAASAGAEFFERLLRGSFVSERSVEARSDIDPMATAGQLPRALVTPRMLAHADWIEWVGPVAL